MIKYQVTCTEACDDWGPYRIILISYEAVRKFAHDAINLILCTEKGMNLFQIDQDGETLDIDDWCDFMRTKKRFYQGKSLTAVSLANEFFI